MFEMLDDECVCGQCVECRRSAREMERSHAVQAPAVLSETARRILDEGAYFEPSKPVRAPRKTRESAAVASGDLARRRALAEERKSQRVLVGNHLVHPNPGSPHGSAGAYRCWYCRCAQCRAYGAAMAKQLRDRRKAARG